MDKIGFIGYGSMGSMLINGFIESGKLSPEKVIVSSRTKEKLNPLSQRWPKIAIADDNISVARNSKILFICVKPLDVIPLLDKLKARIPYDCHLVSIAGCVTIENIEALFKGKVTKVIPSLTSEVREGILLFCHNSFVDPESASTLESLFHGIGKVMIIEENDFEVASDLTSCAPGLIAAIFQNFVDGGLRHSTLSQETAHDMVISTLLGTAKLLLESKMSFSEVISRVATKGGITEGGVKTLNSALPNIFDEVFNKSLSKHEHIKGLVRKQVDKITG